MTRPSGRTDVFLELVQRARRGRLKLYIGFAAGVGKTYRMLEEAHDLQERGIDVVLGLIESHGRADVEALVEGLEVIPRKKVTYRGAALEEMDLEAVLERRPEFVVVDEIAHSNVPGAAHEKRYQDVLELMGAGINVIGAFNVQHLESLNDLVRRATGLKVRETVPDFFLEEADQVVNLDLAVEDLLERLRAGKIYGKEKIPVALRHFFQASKLAALRELSLREVAESLDRDITQAERRLASGKVMVCISSYARHAASLIRRGARMAGHLNTEWYVAHVETPRESSAMTDTIRRGLEANYGIARALEAEVVQLSARDPVLALLSFAASNDVQVLVIGRSNRTWLRRSFADRMLRRAEGFDVVVISVEEE